MSEAEVASVATERKLILLAVATGVVGALVLSAMEVFLLYKEILAYVPAAIVGTLSVIVGPL